MAGGSVTQPSSGIHSQSSACLPMSDVRLHCPACCGHRQAHEVDAGLQNGIQHSRPQCWPPVCRVQFGAATCAGGAAALAAMPLGRTGRSARASAKASADSSSACPTANAAAKRASASSSSSAPPAASSQSALCSQLKQRATSDHRLGHLQRATVAQDLGLGEATTGRWARRR